MSYLILLISSPGKSCRSPSPLPVVNGETLELPEGATFSQFVNSVHADQSATSPSPHSTSPWRPLLLVIPLRLGLTEINPIYFDSLKVRHMIKQKLLIYFFKQKYLIYDNLKSYYNCYSLLCVCPIYHFGNKANYWGNHGQQSFHSFSSSHMP